MTPLGLPCWDVIPGSGVRSQAEATCVNGFQHRVRLTSLSDETLKPRSLVPEFVYRASQRSNGTLINPGIQVGCQWKLTWSYKQSTPHMYHTQSAAMQIGVTSLYALQDNKNIPAYTHPHSTSLRASHDQQYRVPHTTNPIDAYTYSFFPRTIRIWNILPAAIVHASTIEGFKNGLQKEFLSGNMYVVSPRGQYDRPRLGSSASLPVVGPV